MRKTTTIIFVLLALCASAQKKKAKATIQDINKSMVATSVQILDEDISFTSVPKEMLDRVKTENDYGSGYDVNMLNLYSIISNIQNSDIPRLAKGDFTEGELIQPSDPNAAYFKYRHEHKLASLKNNIDQLAKKFPALDASGFQKVYDACLKKLNAKKEKDNSTIKKV